MGYHFKSILTVSEVTSLASSLDCIFMTMTCFLLGEPFSIWRAWERKRVLISGPANTGYFLFLLNFAWKLDSLEETGQLSSFIFIFLHVSWPVRRGQVFSVFCLEIFLAKKYKILLYFSFSVAP